MAGFGEIVVGVGSLLVVAQDINVLIVGLHEILLAGNFLNGCWIALKFIETSDIVCVALPIRADFILQIIDLEIKLNTSHNAVFVKKHHDEGSHNDYDGVFIVRDELPETS